jgi:hypothetical protein
VHGSAAVYTIDDFVRRVVESLVRGECRGQLVCSRCLVKLTRDHLDRSYAKPDVTRVVDDIFASPGSLPAVTTAICALCARKKVPCLGAAPADSGGKA